MSRPEKSPIHVLQLLATTSLTLTHLPSVVGNSGRNWKSNKPTHVFYIYEMDRKPHQPPIAITRHLGNGSTYCELFTCPSLRNLPTTQLRGCCSLFNHPTKHLYVVRLPHLRSPSTHSVKEQGRDQSATAHTLCLQHQQVRVQRDQELPSVRLLLKQAAFCITMEWIKCRLCILKNYMKFRTPASMLSAFSNIFSCFIVPSEERASIWAQVVQIRNNNMYRTQESSSVHHKMFSPVAEQEVETGNVVTELKAER